VNININRLILNKITENMKIAMTNYEYFMAIGAGFFITTIEI